MQLLNRYRYFSRANRNLLFYAIGAICFFGQTSHSNAETLTIGSSAPSINVEHWVHNGEGRFSKVENFESGKVYIVEFWATWCGPCIASMPHIVEVQNKYADKGVQLVSISDEKLEVVEKFLEKKLPNPKEDGPSTYGELTKSYCLTADPDKSVHKDYMTAAERHGIPCCFIVGKDAKIEWIGHPMRMDEPLEQVVEGTWDRETFGKNFRIEHAREELLYQVRVQSMAATKEKDYDKIIDIVDRALAKADTDAIKFELMSMKLPAFANASVSPTEIEKNVMAMFDLSENVPVGAKASKLISSSRLVYDLYIQDKITDEAVVKRTIRTISPMIDSLPATTKAIALDSLAHMKFVTGDLTGAIDTQGKAVELTRGKQQETYQKFLDELNATSEEKAAKK